MRTRQQTMTLLLVWTLLTNLGHYERGSVAGSGEADRNEAISKRRFLERIIRLGLAPADRQAFHLQTSSQQHLYPASSDISRRALEFPPEILRDVPVSSKGTSKTETQSFGPLGSSLSQWYYSNLIPSSNEIPEVENLGQFSFSTSKNNSLVVNKKLSNLFDPMSSGSEFTIPILRQKDLAEIMEDSSLRRRHAEQMNGEDEKTTLSKKEIKRLRKLERQKKREEKRKQRNKEKERKRKIKDKRIEEILKNEDVVIHKVDGDEYIDCCPTSFVVTEISVGKDRHNHAVEVMANQNYFYERPCLPEIVNKSCVFPVKFIKKGIHTKCVQQFSYVPALVRPFRSELDWKVDYIHVRSGCTCQVRISNRKKKNVK